MINFLINNGYIIDAQAYHSMNEIAIKESCDSDLSSLGLSKTSFLLFGINSAILSGNQSNLFGRIGLDSIDYVLYNVIPRINGVCVGYLAGNVKAKECFEKLMHCRYDALVLSRKVSELDLETKTSILMACLMFGEVRISFDNGFSILV